MAKSPKRLTEMIVQYYNLRMTADTQPLRPGRQTGSSRRRGIGTACGWHWCSATRPRRRCPCYAAGQCRFCDIGAGEGAAATAEMNRQRLAWFQGYYRQILPEVVHFV